jgi:predicted transcriptional regulator
MGCGCGCAKNNLSDEQKKVLQAMADCDGPCAAKDVAAATGLDAKMVSAKIADLKKQGYVDSPARCRYGITAEGRAAVKA